MELFGIVLNCLELLKSYKWIGWTGLDSAEKPSPLRAPAVLIKHSVRTFIFIIEIIAPRRELLNKPTEPL